MSAGAWAVGVGLLLGAFFKYVVSGVQCYMQIYVYRWFLHGSEKHED